MKERWQTTAVLVMLALIFGFLLGHSAILPRAEAQGEATAGRIATMMGQPVTTRGQILVPIVIVDGLQQSIMVYDYSLTAEVLELKAARSFRWDKEIVEYKNGTGGPSTKAVQQMLNR